MNVRASRAMNIRLKPPAHARSLLADTVGYQTEPRSDGIDPKFAIAVAIAFIALQVYLY